jgi:hypothetical protein
VAGRGLQSAVAAVLTNPVELECKVRDGNEAAHQDHPPHKRSSVKVLSARGGSLRSGGRLLGWNITIKLCTYDSNASYDTL